jgi:hypothetical protein
MSLIHDLAAKLEVLWDHKMILESQNPLGASSETLCFTQLQPSSDVLHSNVSLLSGNDIFFDGWNKGYVVYTAMWNHSETQLFRVTIGTVRLDG